MKEAVLNSMLADAAIAVIVADRIAWSERVRGSPLPSITLFRVGGAQGVTTDGADGLDDADVHCDCWAENPDDADTLAVVVKAWASSVNRTSTVGALQGVFVSSEQDFPEGEGPERIHRTTLTLQVWRPAP